MNVPGMLIEGQDLDLPKSGDGALSIIDLAADRKCSQVNLDIMQPSIHLFYSDNCLFCSPMYIHVAPVFHRSASKTLSTRPLHYRHNPIRLVFKNLSVLWLDEVGKGLWLALVWVCVTVVETVGVVVVVVSVSIILWADILHLVDGAALWAALDWALAGHLICVSICSSSSGISRLQAWKAGKYGNIRSTRW